MAYGAHVQSIGAAIGDGPVQTLAYSSNVAAGDTLVAVLRFGNVPGSISLTDTRGNTWTQVPFTPDALQFAVFYVLNCASSGANTVTVTIGSSDASIRLILAEYEGSSTLNVSAGAFGAGTTLNSGNLVTTIATTLIVGGGGAIGARTFSPGTNFTERQQTENRLMLEDRLVTSAGTYTATMTIDSSDDWAMVGAAFASAGMGGQTVTVTPVRVQWGVQRPQVPRVLLPAKLKWQTQGRKEVIPARMQWRARTVTPSRGPWGTYVQGVSFALGDGPVQSLPYDAIVAQGNTLFAAVRFGNVPGTIALTDSLGNTWQQIPYTAGSLQFYCFYVLSSVASGVNTVTVTIDSIDASIRLILAEYEGSSFLNTTSGATGTGTALDSGNLVTTIPTTLLVGAGSTFGPRNFTPGASFTERQELDTRVALEDRLVLSASTYTATMSLNASDGWAMVAAAFSQSTFQTATVTPARVQWVATVTAFPAMKTVQPARLRWQVPAAGSPNVARLVPAQMQWGAQTSRIAQGPWGAYVQSIAAELGDGPVVALAYTAAVRQDNTLFAAIRFGNVPGTITITDTLGNTWQQVAYSGGTLEFECFYVLSCAATGANTVTITIDSADANVRVILAEYYGSSVLHASSGNTGTSAALSSGSLVTTIARTLLLGAGGTLGNPGFTPGANFTEREELVNRLALEDRILTSVGTYVADMDISTANTWAMVGVVFGEQQGTLLVPARVQWTAQTIRTEQRKSVLPARVSWRVQALRRVLRPLALVLAQRRRLPQPRLRVVPTVGVDRSAAQQQGLALWFLAHPWHFGGAQWHDLLTGMPGDMLNGADWTAEHTPGGRGALRLDGGTQAVQMPAHPLHSGWAQCTLSAWVYPRSYGTTGKARILDKIGVAALGGFYLGLTNGDGALRAVEFGVDGATMMIAVSANGVIDLDTWTHVAVVWNGSFRRADCEIYINGTQVAVQGGVIGQEGQAPTHEDSANALYVGNRDTLDRGFEGRLDDIRLYQAPLTATAIWGLYSEGMSGDYALLRQPPLAVPFLQAEVTGTVTQAAVPARLQWRASTGTPRISLGASPARLRWQAQAGRAQGARSIVPAQMSWRAMAPVARGTVPEGRRPTIVFPILSRWHRKPPPGTMVDWNHPLTRGLEACWLFNEGQGSRAYDATGNGHTLALGLDATGLPPSTVWSGDSPPQLQGPTVAFLASPVASPLGNVTEPVFHAANRHYALEFWIRVEPSTKGYGILFDHPQLAPTESIFVHQVVGGFEFFFLSSDGSSGVVGPTPLPLKTWMHVVITRHKNPGGIPSIPVATTPNLLICTVDGYNRRTRDAGAMPLGYTTPLAPQWSHIGVGWNQASLDSASFANFVGSLALLRIWGRGLSIDETEALFARPFDMFSHRRSMFYAQLFPAVPSRVAWAAQRVTVPRILLPVPSPMAWAAQMLRQSGVLSDPQPVQMQWKVGLFHRTLTIEPARLQWRSGRQTLPINLVLRDCGEVYEAALQKTSIGGDWLISAPAIGLYQSFNYAVGPEWDHRIVDISDIEISAPPGGGIASAANVTVSIAETGEGQSIITLWEQASAVGAVEVTIDFLLRDADQVLRIFTGSIDSITVKDAVAQLLLVDDSIRKNLVLPKELVTVEEYPNADTAALTKVQPLVYGQGSKIGACPMLFVDVTNNTYLVAAHPMRLGGSLAVYDQPNKTFLLLPTVIFIPNNGAASITLGTLNTSQLQNWSPAGGIVNPTYAVDGNSLTKTIIPTTFAGPGYDSAIQIGDGWGYGAWSISVPGSPLAGTLKIDITNHRRSPGSDPTVTGTFFFRTVNETKSAEGRKLFISPAFNHTTSAQNNTFILSNVNIGINEIFDILLITRCQGQIGGANQTYEVGEISVTPLVAFSANISGTPTAVGLPINLQELRFNPQRPALSVYVATNVINPTHALDGNSATWANIQATSVDSNLDGYGELIVTADVTSAQRGNNTVVIDLIGHRRALTSTPTLTGTFSIQTYNTATGTLLRDNLFVTQAFRHQTNPLTTSFTATAINLGATTQLAIRTVARNEGGAGSAGQIYEVREIGVETFYQPRGDSGELYIYGEGYEGRTDITGTITDYIGTVLGRLLQTPDMVIASIFEQELALSVNLPSFATAYNYFQVQGLRFDGGIGAGWAIEQGNARDILNELARQSTSILFPAFDATWGIRPFRTDTSVHQTFNSSNILTEMGSENQRAEDRASTVQLTMGNLQDVYNHFEVRYKFNAGSQKYDNVWKVTKDGSNLPASFPGKAAIELTVLQSWLRYGDLEPLIVNAHWIADDTTAAYLLQHLALYSAQQRITCQFETTFKAACLQVGDFVAITDNSLPAGDNGGTFEVHTIRYMPMKGRIQLVTSRVSTIPDVTLPSLPLTLTGCAKFADTLRGGMIACWDFEEVSGNRIDHINEYALVPVNSPGSGTGKIGNAIQLRRASSQYLTAGQSLGGIFTGEFTFACWVRLRSVPTDWGAIYSNDSPVSGFGFREIWIGVGPTDTRLHVGVGTLNTGGMLHDPAQLFPFTDTVADWSLLRVWRTWTAGGNGVLSAQINNGTIFTNTFTGAIAHAEDNVRVGAGNTGPGVLAFLGNFDLDTMMIWRRVLSSTERDALWNGGMG